MLLRQRAETFFSLTIYTHKVKLAQSHSTHNYCTVSHFGLFMVTPINPRIKIEQEHYHTKQVFIFSDRHCQAWLVASPQTLKCVPQYELEKVLFTGYCLQTGRT